MDLSSLGPSEVEQLLAHLTPDERAAFDALLVGSPAVLTFREFVGRVNPRFRWYRHCGVLADVLQRVADDELHRVLVFEPPRHGKSEEVSRLFPAYYLYRHPERWVGISSYAADLAYTFSRAARANYSEIGRPLKDDASAVRHWETGYGGGLWAAGVGGPITGKGFHLGIVDDPLKNAEDAASEVIREKQWEWYRSTFLTRAEPGAAIIVTMTRWHQADLAGRILELAAEVAEGWHIVAFEAIRGDEWYPTPAGCTIEDDWREPGEALCPERYPIEKLRQAEVTQGPYLWSALFMQRPIPRGGSMFPRQKAITVDAVPAKARRIRYWDKAGTEGGGARTAGVRMSEYDGLIYVEHVVTCQLGSHERNQLMRQTAESDGTGVHQWVEQEPGSGGKESAEATIRLLAGFSVWAEKVTGDKVTRADPFAAQWQAGNVRLVRGDWIPRYLDELEAFPNGRYKDQVDASSGAYNKLVGRVTPNIRVID